MMMMIMMLLLMMMTMTMIINHLYTYYPKIVIIIWLCIFFLKWIILFAVMNPMCLLLYSFNKGFLIISHAAGSME